MKKFVIFAPPYCEKEGGTICLHKLTHLINESGRQAYLYPEFENIELSNKNIIIPLLKFGRSIFRVFTQKYKLNKDLNTPVFNGSVKEFQSDEWIIIYGEQVFGNPLKAKNVVRWLLHQPGFHTGNIYYGFNELHVKFNNAIRDFHFPNSLLASETLPIIDYPINLYNEDKIAKKRHGIAYCIRKGRGKHMQHKLEGSICIDNLSHREIASIFKTVQVFISYDSYTAYSRFAALCGCDSIVVPDAGVSEQEWYPNPEDRYGVSYGFENIVEARKTRHLLRKKIYSELNASADAAEIFIKNCDEYFIRKKYDLFRAEEPIVKRIIRKVKKYSISINK